MKKLLIVILAFTFSLTAFSQQYEKFLTNESHWYVSYCNFSCVTDYYLAKQDTVIGSYTYKLLDRFHFMKNMALREDTILKRVYFLSVPANKETLLYDFGLLPGDSMEVNNPISPLPSNAGWYLLDSIKLEPFLDGSHKVFYLSEKYGSNTTRWVEGMGSFALVNTPSSDRDLNGTGDLTCFYKDGIKVYESDTLPTGECDTLLMVGVKPIMNSDNSLNVYPNPAKNYFTVGINLLTVKPAKIAIYNIDGKIIHSDILNNFKTRIDCQNWQNGIYFIELTRGDKVYSEKLIVQN